MHRYSMHLIQPQPTAPDYQQAHHLFTHATAPAATAGIPGDPSATVHQDGGPADQPVDDYQLARYYQEQAKTFRDKWIAGRMREIAYVTQRAEARDPRFRRMTPNELEVTARTRWSQSGLARKLAGYEERFSQLARMHLAFAEFQLLRIRQ